jgi:hypothetical protein
MPVLRQASRPIATRDGLPRTEAKLLLGRLCRVVGHMGGLPPPRCDPSRQSRQHAQTKGATKVITLKLKNETEVVARTMLSLRGYDSFSMEDDAIELAIVQVLLEEVARHKSPAKPCHLPGQTALPFAEE